MTATALGAQDSLRLGALQADAARLDPRQQQIALQAAASAVRLRTIRADAKPSFAFDAKAQYQSEVIQLRSAPGFPAPVLPHDTWEAALVARQSLYDPTIGPRRALEQAQLGESQAQVRTTLYTLRQELNDAFFTAVSLQERIAAIDAAIANLAARLREASRRFDAGAALPGDTATLAATLIQRQQDRLRLTGERAGALARLSVLVGRDIPPEAPLAVPDLRARLADVSAMVGELRSRPEYAQFDATRNRLATQEASASAQLKPRVFTFGRFAYGKPGLDILSADFHGYWLGGVQVQWAPWNWGSTARDREVLRIQRQIVTTNEAAFALSVRRGVDQSLASIARMDSSLALDEQVVALREIVVREATAKLREGAITAAEYVDRDTELLSARVARIQHRAEVAHARASLLTLLGVELP
ncbi:MAG: TolC family protein [Gemmatimonadaceae bacterium]